MLLIPDPNTTAFQDTYYKSSFTDNPTEMWPGEPGVVIIRSLPNNPLRPTAELKKTWNNFKALREIWLDYEGQYSKEDCPIRQKKSDDEQEKEDDKDDKDEGDDEDANGDEEDSEEDDQGSEDTSSSRKGRKRIYKQQDSTHHQSPLQDIDAKKLTPASKRRKDGKDKERHWRDAAPYDETVPYSHRHGYTWANSTANDVMQMWQAYRK
ncbi:MAG: hypothetical protein M1825_003944 [Sarcosagium campestre]|nr:MAG: hypothetical protein M1825_003944 [Sarcosagium campestre]